MLRLVAYLVGIAVVATGLSWLADRPGLIVFNWEGYEGEISVFHAVVGLTFLVGVAILFWSLARAIWTSPATVGNYFYRRRQKRGLDALSSGIIAIGAGDGANAMRYAVQARKSLPNEPLTHLLRAQAAQLAGDKTTTRRIFEAMLAQPDTEQLGLRGLFLEAQREGELEAARQFAERALRLNPKLGWSSEALFDLQCKAGDWEDALQTLASAKKYNHVDKAVADRRRAVLLTAQAQKAEDQDPQRGVGLALEAHGLAPALVPAAAIAGRLLASRGNTAKAAKVLQNTWLKSPHPDLAAAYAYARIGDSPTDRLERVRQLANLQQNSVESAVAVARVAIEAKRFDVAREALEPLLEDRLTQRVATLMARVEAEEKGDAGRVREWLARAVNAQRDPAWTADGVVSEQWAPISPVTGQLDAFQWRVPAEALESQDSGLLADKLAELAAISGPLEAIDAKPVTVRRAEKTVEAAEDSDVAEVATRPAPVMPASSTNVTAKTVAVAAPAAAERVAAATPVVAETAAPTPAPAAPSPAAMPVSAVTAAAAPAPAQEAAKPASGVATSSSAPASDGGGVKPAAAPTANSTAVAVVPAPGGSGGAALAPAGKSVAVAGKGASESKPAAGSAEPKIFVSPRAPDDPGPDAGEVEDVEPLLPRYGTNR